MTRKRRDPVTALLEAARRRISDPARWTKAYQARDADGLPCNPWEPQAWRWCAVGALWAESGAPALRERRDSRFEQAYRRLGESAPGHDWWPIEDVNDTRGHAAVLAVFDAAIRGK